MQEEAPASPALPVAQDMGTLSRKWKLQIEKKFQHPSRSAMNLPILPSAPCTFATTVHETDTLEGFESCTEELDLV